MLAAPLTQPDRNKLIQDLEHSREVFLAAITDVKTEAKWNYKPAADRWSVGECAAHIIAAEDGDALISKMVRDQAGIHCCFRGHLS